LNRSIQKGDHHHGYSYKHYAIQLKDGFDGAAIITAGGTVHVARPARPTRRRSTPTVGTALANPLTPTRGFIDFYTLDTVASVDLYIMAPGGQFVVVPASWRRATTRSGRHRRRSGRPKIPFSIADALPTPRRTPASTAGAVLGARSLLGGMGVLVTTLDAGQNILFGLCPRSPAAMPTALDQRVAHHGGAQGRRQRRAVLDQRAASVRLGHGQVDQLHARHRHRHRQGLHHPAGILAA
jgi:hypothetical protein